MALKINYGKKQSIAIPQSAPKEVEEEIVEEPAVEEIEQKEEVLEQSDDSLEEVTEEPSIQEDEQDEHKEKRSFEGHNKDVLSAEPPAMELPVMDDLEAMPAISVAPSNTFAGGMDEARQKIIERETKRVELSIDEEIRREQEALRVASDMPIVPELRPAPTPQMPVAPVTKPITAVCIGGNEQYYKTVLAPLSQAHPNIKFLKYIPVGGRNAFYTIDTMNPDIIVINHNTQLQSAIQFHEAISKDSDDNGVPYAEKFRDKRIVVIAPNDFNYEMELRARNIGFFVKEINPKTHAVNIDELVTVIEAAYDDIEASKNAPVTAPMQGQQQALSPRALYQQQQEAALAAAQAMSAKQVIGVYSASGGAGKTMFATNMAAILAKYSNQDGGNNYRVCLVEYNLVCQNIDLFFNIKSDKNIGLLAQEVASNYINQETGKIEIEPAEMRPMISQYVYKEANTGLDILLGISVPLENDRIKKGFSECLFRTLREMYDVVIVDMSADIAKQSVLETFKSFDCIYYIMPMEVTAIRNTKVLFKFLTGLFKFAPEDIKVIINKVDADNEEFGVDQVYKALAAEKCVPEGTIPNDEREVLSSINRGAPLAIEAIEHPVAQAIYSIALGINPMISNEIGLEEEPEKKKSGLLGLFGGKKKENSEKKPSFRSKKEKSEKKPFALKMRNSKDAPKETPKVSSQNPPIPPELEDDYENEPMGAPAEMPEYTRVKGLDEAEEEKPKKQGFLAKLFASFGSKKKKKVKVNDKRQETTSAPLLNSRKKKKFPRKG